jgi:hypothetical protein
MGKEHLKRIKRISHETALTCLIPFFDLCNHRSSKTGNPKDKIDFLLQWASGEVRVATDANYIAGEEYDYSYSPKAGNDKLVMIYGFYINDNPYSHVKFLLPVNKVLFNKDKYQLCKDLNLFETDLSGFHDSQYNLANIEAMMNRTAIDENILNTMKVIVYPPEQFVKDRQNIARNIKKGRWISYQNEIQGIALYREYVNTAISKAKMSFV